MIKTLSKVKKLQNPWYKLTWDAQGSYSSEVGRPGGPAFCFDIDGVLVKGKKVLDAAKSAMAKLYGRDGMKPRYPVCFLTNGGGVLESQKAEQLSSWLSVNVTPEQVILSHTPFKFLVPRLAQVPVLLSGRHDIQKVASSYGFQKTVTVDQLSRSFPRAVPNFPPLQSGKEEAFSTEFGSEKQPIQAILMFSDPENWYIDLQLITDVITSGGVIGRSKPDPGAKPMEIIFSNPDKLFSNDFPTPRFGQGAFQVALQAVLDQVVNKPAVRWQTFGKPNIEPYKIAIEALRTQAESLHGPSGKETPFSNIYMIGDNPEADMAGAKNAGPPWKSVLVRTGVFDGSTPNSLTYPADLVVNDVKDAIDAIFHRDRSQLWHSMR